MLYEVLRILLLVRAVLVADEHANPAERLYNGDSDGSHSTFSRRADARGRNVHDLVCWVIGPRWPHQRESAVVANPLLLDDVCKALAAVLPDSERTGDRMFGPDVEAFAEGLPRVKAVEWVARAIEDIRGPTGPRDE